MTDRPKIIGWEVSINENGVEMASLPRDILYNYMKWAEEMAKESTERK